MCDERTERDNEELLRRTGKLSRRGFATIATAAGFSMLLPRAAHAVDVVDSHVTITTPDGEADCYFVHPSDAAAPAVLVWPDIFGLRPVFEAMGKRLAEEGYAVLVVNPFYRDAVAPVVDPGASFQEAGPIVFPLAQSLTPERTITDATAFIGWLDSQDAVDTSRPVGTTGYCMGGPLIMRTAAALPDRVGAAASFHGGGVASEEDGSPLMLVPEMKASFLFAIAANDDENDPGMKDRLRAAYDAAGLSAEIEVYEGANHGWCVPQSAAYNEAQAERAWSRLLALFETALA